MESCPDVLKAVALEVIPKSMRRIQLLIGGTVKASLSTDVMIPPTAANISQHDVGTRFGPHKGVSNSESLIQTSNSRALIARTPTDNPRRPRIHSNSHIMLEMQAEISLQLIARTCPTWTTIRKRFQTGELWRQEPHSQHPN